MHGLLVLAQQLVGVRPSLERLGAGMSICPNMAPTDSLRLVQLERLVTVSHDLLVLWRRVVAVASGSVRVEDGIPLDRHLDGLGVALGSRLVVLLRVEAVTPVFQRSAELISVLP